MNPANQNPSILSQIEKWFFVEIEEPYSTIETNLILICVAVILFIIVAVFNWMATHQDRVRRFAVGLRQRSRVRQAERNLRAGLAFLLRRFDVAGAYGLSFSITLSALFLGIWFFGNVLEHLLSYDQVAFFDMPVAGFIAGHRIPWLTSLMQAAVLPATGIGMAIAALGMVVFLRRRRGSPRVQFFLLAVLAGAAMLDMVAERLTGMPPQPESAMAVPAVLNNLLLGHTLVCVFYGAVAYLITRTQSAWEDKVLVWSAAGLVAVLTGVARVYLGADWPTEIISRWALALTWLSAALVVAAIIEQSVADRDAPEKVLDLDGQGADALPTPPSVVDLGRPEVSINGLSRSAVAERQKRGEVNILIERSSRSIKDILTANVFTRLNALLVGLFILILLVGGTQDAVFGLVVVANTVIGVVQELRAKRTLDRLSVLVAPRARVVRDGEVHELPTDQIVIDDVVECRPGDQIPVDGILLAAEDLEVNESLLTGEADPIARARGELVLSGSFVVSGSGRLQAVQIGEASYARRLARVARKFSLSQSQLRDGVNDILRYSIWALVPTTVVLYASQLLYGPAGAQGAAVSSVAVIVGMIPEGLVLLMSTIMAVAIVRLSGQGALIQELAAVELLARVDVICADKTGTLTEGQSTLEEIVPAGAVADGAAPVLPEEVRDVLGVFAHDDASPTASSLALREACARPDAATWSVVGSVPFSSSRKWSAFAFARQGTWILGAPEVVLAGVEGAGALLARVQALAGSGKRVLALVSSSEPIALAGKTHTLPSIRQPRALIVLGEKIRTDVARTVRYFEEQGVSVKIVSGDHPETIRAIASQVGLHPGQQAFDARKLPDDPAAFSEIVEGCDLFGRVTPLQKRRMVECLRADGHVVAMIGDGINDVLAIKEADFGIALGSGTAASRAVAQLTLLRDDFAALPAVIAEGRRVIGNVERTANLFITKTAYVFAMALAIGIAQAPFPFLPRHLTLISFITIGIPGIFLSFANGGSLVRPGFVGRVLRFSLPAGAIAAAATLLAYTAARALAPDYAGLAQTAATIALAGNGLVVLWLLARPQHLRHRLFMAVLPSILLLVLAFRPLRDFFALQLPNLPVWLTIIAINIVAGWILLKTRRFSAAKSGPARPHRPARDPDE